MSAKASERRKPLVLCTQPWFKIADVEKLHPGLVKHWLWYHHEVVGVAEFWLYDNDGSLGPFLSASGYGHLARYFARWPDAFPSLKELARRGWQYVGEALAYDHCLYNNLGAADWIAYLPFLDNWYHLSAKGRGGHRPLTSALERLRGADPGGPPLCSVSVRRCDFGVGPGLKGVDSAPSGQLGVMPGKYLMRRENCSLEDHFMRDDPILSGDGSAVYALGHRAVCRPGARVAALGLREWRSNHYIDMLKTRCGAACHVRDPSLLRTIASRMQPLPAASREERRETRSGAQMRGLLAAYMQQETARPGVWHGASACEAGQA